jgi:small GTP-binding protein
VDFKNKVVQINGMRIRLQIWDTAGQERFTKITQTYFKGATGIILSYSITDSSSFSNLETWIKQINEHSQNDVIKFLVATKIDLEESRKVSEEEGKRVASKYHMEFMEVSSKTGINISELFDSLSRKVADSLRNAKQNNSENAGKRFTL